MTAHQNFNDAATASAFEISAAFKERQACLALSYNDLGLAGQEAANRGIDRETEIMEASATSIADVICKLWAALGHVDQTRELEKAILRGDYATIATLDPELDWGSRTLLDAVLQLERLTGVQVLSANAHEIGGDA